MGFELLSDVTELGKGRMNDIHKISHFPLTELKCSQGIVLSPSLREPLYHVRYHTHYFQVAVR